MITASRASIAFVALGYAFAAADLSARDFLFRKASRNYDQTGELGRAYTREFESRMFTHEKWTQRLYCYRNHRDDMNDTLEVYSRLDGSRWLSYRHARPSLDSEIISHHFTREQFDLKRSLDSRRISGREIRLPGNVATEVDALWRVMLPGLDREPRTNTRRIIINGPMFIGFRREGGSVLAGTLADAAYGTLAYRKFVDIVDDLIDSCRTSGKARDAILARLPKKMQDLRRLLDNQRPRNQAVSSRSQLHGAPLISRAAHV